MNKYQETLDFMFSQLPMFQDQGLKAMNNKLDKSLALDSYFNHPHKSYKTLHIGGTNGKGSVSHLLASVLQSATYKVGLYTSPHLKDFRERIKVNGTACSETFVIDFIEKHKQIITKLKPSFFEMTVAMALQYFKEQQVDIAVIEVGLGGRLDSTNIISPILSIITNISIDHTALLGDNLEAIAREKAGIIKPGSPVIIGEYQKEIADIFKNKALENKTSICFAEDNYHLTNIKKTPTEIIFDWEDIKEIHSPLRATYQEKNSNTVLTAIKSLQNSKLLTITEAHIKNGFNKVVTQTQFQGRWQAIAKTPLTICEAAHNEAGIRMAMQELKNLEYNKLHIILGVSNDKDLRNILPLFPKEAFYYFTQAQVPRAMAATELYKLAKKYNLSGVPYENVANALSVAQEKASQDDLIYIGGSIFIVAEVVN